MRHVHITLSDGRTLRVAVPSSARERARGLLGRESLAPDEAMLIPHARSIHTFGMRIPIAVAWLDDAGVVLRTRTVEPNRIAWGVGKSRHVLESAAGAGPAEGEHLAADTEGLPWRSRAGA